jgi:hypothetical protein
MTRSDAKKNGSAKDAGYAQSYVDNAVRDSAMKVPTPKF